MGSPFNTNQWNNVLPGGTTSGAPGIFTAQQIIYMALRLLGQLRAGTTTYGGSTSGQMGSSPELMADGLFALNSLIDSWSTNRLNIFTISDAIYPFATSQQSYQIGPGAVDFDAPRPIRIERANIIITANAAQPARTPLIIVDSAGWARVQVPATATSVPIYLYCDYASPIANLWFWPYPTGNRLELFTWTALVGASDLTVPVATPPGYLRALIYNLAVEMAPMVEISTKTKQKTISTVFRIAAESLAAIQSVNAPSYQMSVDSGLPGIRYGRSFNPLTGDCN
jgi:hypothetical protein